MSRQYDPYENVVAVMEEAMNIGGIDKRMFEIIKIHSVKLRFTFLWRWMTEVLKVFEGYKSSSNSNIRGPFKGGIRYHKERYTLNEVKALATWMSLKCASGKYTIWRSKGWYQSRSGYTFQTGIVCIDEKIYLCDRADHRSRYRYTCS